MEEWMFIDEFDDYEISNYGIVKRNGKEVLQSQTSDGTMKVNLRRDRQTFTRSVAKLVAQAFVPNPHPNLLEEFDSVMLHRRHRPVWDTPIHLDNDTTNNYAGNLAWRPRWFAWKYRHQWNEDPEQAWYEPVFATYQDGTSDIHESIIQAGVADGVLWRDIFSSCVSGDPTFPSGTIYSWTTN